MSLVFGGLGRLLATLPPHGSRTSLMPPAKRGLDGFGITTWSMIIVPTLRDSMKTSHLNATSINSSRLEDVKHVSNFFPPLYWLRVSFCLNYCWRENLKCCIMVLPNHVLHIRAHFTPVQEENCLIRIFFLFHLWICPTIEQPSEFSKDLAKFFFLKSEIAQRREASM